jgi:hypothetical protein
MRSPLPFVAMGNASTRSSGVYVFGCLSRADLARPRVRWQKHVSTERQRHAFAQKHPVRQRSSNATVST